MVVRGRGFPKFQPFHNQKGNAVCERPILVWTPKEEVKRPTQDLWIEVNDLHLVFGKGVHDAFKCGPAIGAGEKGAQFQNDRVGDDEWTVICPGEFRRGSVKRIMSIRHRDEIGTVREKQLHPSGSLFGAPYK